jgi:hypothetical protein
MIFQSTRPAKSAQSNLAQRRLRASTALVCAGLIGLCPVTTSADAPAAPNATGQNSPQAGSVKRADFASTGFAITIGQTNIAGAPPPRRQLNGAVATPTAVTVQFDGLKHDRELSATPAQPNARYPAGAVIALRAHTNYPAFVDRAEVRIVDLSRHDHPVVAVLPSAPNGVVHWTMPDTGSADYAYVLRVTDAQGRHDETHPLTLTRDDSDTASHQPLGPVRQDNSAQTMIAQRHIPLKGGMITISGQGATPASRVRIMGHEATADLSGRFVINRIVPAGHTIVDVTLNGRTLRRDVYVPPSEWSGVGIIDITAGIRRDSSAGVDDTRYINGRAAFYTKGQTQSGWTITASADTRDGPLKDMFRRLSDKDPRRVLDRLRTSDDLFPTYGDDSTFYDDAPTAGAIYLRAENDTTRLTWGTFRTGIEGSALLGGTRDLYGAEMQFRSANRTAHGDRRATLTAYAAQPETLPQRDVLRGTGGSVYFLTRQDITGGSSSVMIQAIDPDTGRVLSSQTLTEGSDYTLDHFQGILTLAEPLASNGGQSGIIGSVGEENQLHLVVQYEYTPTSLSPDASALGARGEVWVSDSLRLGGTIQQEATSGAQNQIMLGADLHYRIGANSSVDLEMASTEGPGLSRATSGDGGLTIASTGGASNARAQALSFDSHIAFADLGWERDGHLSLWYERKEAGFSTLHQDISADQNLIGIDLETALTDRLSFALQAEQFRRDGGDRKKEAEASLTWAISDHWTVATAVQHLDQTSAGTPQKTGKRDDAAVRLTWSPSDTVSLYAYGQTTIRRQGGLPENNRIGLGGETQLSERLHASGEVSDGSGGRAGRAQLKWTADENREVYIGYSRDPDLPGLSVNGASVDHGTWVFGSNVKHSDTLLTWTEHKTQRVAHNGRSRSTAFGLTYTPQEAWTWSGSVETGQVRDDVNGDFDRNAFSLGMTWSPDPDTSGKMRVEYRSDDGDGVARDRETYGLTLGYSSQVNENWRLLADFDALYSDSALGDYHDGEYLRASLGYAYRPVENEHLNMLLRYTYLHDLPGEDQVDSNGDTDGPQQRSHVFALAANYDLNQKLTLGGKLALRKSQIADRGTTTFTSNTATLAALRLDWHAVHNWDLFAEGRALYTKESRTTEYGAAAGIYRHLNDKVKLGIGYEWGQVSADVTDISYDSQGIFINLVAKF